ncbi:GSCOCG00011762001-RA-CDS [Cotesia congregata]|nr:GSCOCG00011762001-RA-CDS [Cotesia congregata]
MTARLNQDKLEQFFGIVRSACGCNEHPDPIIFGQVFRLLCSYSLVTPPKGSNVTLVELLQSLMETRESLRLSKDKKVKWLEKIDSIIDSGFTEDERNVNKNSVAAEPFENLLNDLSEDDVDEDLNYDAVSNSRCNDYSSKTSVANKPFESLIDESSEDDNNNLVSNSANTIKPCSNDPHEDHDYDVAQTSEYVIAYIAGYVTRKMHRFSRCENYLKSLESETSSDRDRVIDLMSEHCKRPSDNLFLLIQKLENTVLSVVGTKTVKIDTMNQIVDKISTEKSLPFLGCDEHQSILMKKILSYFITIRGHFLASNINKNYNEKKMKNKKLRKISKIV